MELYNLYLLLAQYHNDCRVNLDKPTRYLFIYLSIYLLLQPDCVPEGSDIWKYFEDRPSVKAVIYDFDANCNWIKLNQALFYIRREDVTYFVGATDESIILKENYRFLGKSKHQVLIS